MLPLCHPFPLNHTASSTSNRKQYLYDTLGTFVDEFILYYMETVVSLRKEMQDNAQGTADRSTSAEEGMNALCREDGVFNYVCAVLGHGLLGFDLHDASQHGDGGRLYRFWKFLLLYFKAAHRTKYALEAFNLVAQVALLTPRVAHELLWNRVCNPHGGVGQNIPLDLEKEYLNRLFKDDINTFRAHKRAQCQQICQTDWSNAGIAQTFGPTSCGPWHQ